MSLRKGLALGTLIVLLGTSLSGMLAANVVASSRAGRHTQPTAENDVKPSPECDGITLTGTTVGSGSFNATNGNDLVLGSASVDTIGGRNGDDCIVGGASNDSINGGTGNDVCIGGAGTDTFNACEVQIQ
jgi:Ca2+-binding RTX toxin-like protein